MEKKSAYFSESSFELTEGQKGLWFLYKINPTDTAYNLPFAFRIYSSIDVEHLKKCCKVLLDRHPMLRVRFFEKDGVPYQTINQKNDLDFTYIDGSKFNNTELKNKVNSDAFQAFNLESDSIFRVHLYYLNQSNYVLLFNFHHIASDAHSYYVVFDEFFRLYGKEYLPPIDPEKNSYHDYVIAEREWINSKAAQKSLDFWQSEVSGDIPVLQLPIIQTEPINTNEKSENCYHHFEFSQPLIEKITLFAKKNNATVYTILLAAYNILLSKYSGQQDIIVGSPVSGRLDEQFSNTFGYFINVVPIRTHIDQNIKFSDYLKLTFSKTREIIEHQKYPIPLLIKNLKLARQSQSHPLFQTILSIQRSRLENSDKITSIFKTGTRVVLGGIEFENFLLQDSESQFDLALIIRQSSENVTGLFTFNRKILTRDFVERFTKNLQILLWSIAESTDETIADLKYIDEIEYKQIIEHWNSTESETSGQKTIHSLFEEQVFKNPDDIALVYENRRLTYRELNEKSNQLAHYLISTYHVKADAPVGLCLQRSERVIISILAVLKAGAAYVPIDPAYPSDRIQYIMEDTQSLVVITDELYTQLSSKVALESKDNPVTLSKNSDLAYIIYTSGTTGKPKGVMVEHKGVVNNTMFAPTDMYDLSEGNKIASFASYVFDASAHEFFFSLLQGGELHLLSAQVRKDVFMLSDYIVHHEINCIFIPPVLLDTIPRIQYKTLHKIIYGGDSCSIDAAAYWSEHCKLYNCYGPTEATILVTNTQVIKNGRRSIGSPIANTHCYVLDSNLKLLPIDAVGELYIGGIGVARGYLNRPDLTAEKFIRNPFQTHEEKESGKNDRIYKTGDLVRWMHNGQLEYLGRADFQVKIRGFRIELGEIENALLSFRGMTT